MERKDKSRNHPADPDENRIRTCITLTGISVRFPLTHIRT